MAVFDEFHEVQQLLTVQDLHSKVFDDEQIHLGHPVEELGRLGFNAGHLHSFQKFVHVEVTDSEAGEASLIAKSCGQVTFPDTSRAGDENGSALLDVLTGCQLQEAALVASLGGVEDDLLDAGVIAEAGVLDEPGRFVGRALVVLRLDQHHKTVLEDDFLMLPRLLEILPAFSHARQM